MNKFCVAVARRNPDEVIVASKERYATYDPKTSSRWNDWSLWEDWYSFHLYDEVPPWYYTLLAEGMLTDDLRTQQLWLELTEEEVSSYLPEFSKK